MLLSSFLFLPFLPQWAQVCLSVFTGLGGVGSVLALLKVRKEKQDFLIAQATQKAKEEKDLEARLKDYKEFKEKYFQEQEHTKERFTGFSQQLERVAEKAATDCQTINEKFGSVYVLSDKVGTLQLTVNNTDSKVEKLEMQVTAQIGELRAEMRDQTKLLNEILLGIADLGTLRKGK